MIVYLTCNCQVRVEYFQWHLSREGVTSESEQPYCRIAVSGFIYVVYVLGLTC